MTSLQYRLTVIVCVVSWLLVGLHAPALHELTDPAHDARPAALILLGVYGLLGIAAFWSLLRAPDLLVRTSRSRSSAAGAPER